MWVRTQIVDILGAIVVTPLAILTLLAIIAVLTDWNHDLKKPKPTARELHALLKCAHEDAGKRKSGFAAAPWKVKK